MKQRLLSFKTLKQSMTGVQIAFSVAQSLSEAGIPHENLLGTNRDGASVNEVAMSTLQEFRETNGCSAPFWNLKCLAHFLNLVGERMSSNLARSFLAQWKSMMGHSVESEEPLSRGHRAIIHLLKRHPVVVGVGTGGSNLRLVSKDP